MLLSPLLDNLAQGYTIITPTQRLAREILYAYSQKHPQVVIKPKCYSYDSWLQMWYQTLVLQQSSLQPPSLITLFQLERLWLKQSPQQLNQHECQIQLSTLRNCSLAKQEPIGSDFLYTPQAESFSQQWQKLASYLKKHNLLAPFQIAQYLNSKIYPPKTKGIIWAFFDCFHPEQSALQDHLKTLDIEQHFFDFPDEDLNPIRHSIFAADDMPEEHLQILAWIKAQLEAGCQRIGVILPDLANYQDILKLQFKTHFPEGILHFSLGKSLNCFPLVQQALGLLQLNHQIPFEQKYFIALLLSPYIAGYHQEQKARMDVLKHPLFKEPMLYLKDIITLVQPTCPILGQCLEKLSDYPKQQTPSNWVKSIACRLNILGFPGNNHLIAENLQALNQFYSCIENLNLAGLVEDNWQQEDAFEALSHLVQKEIIQAPQNNDGIHIMGWLESSGFIGDALWIGHLDSQNIPQAIKFSPYLPIQWQKKYRLPRTNRENEQVIAKNMLKRLINAHHQKALVLSYAKTNANGEPLWPSVMLPTGTMYSKLPILEKQSPLETIAEDYLLPLKEGQILKGGSQLLSAQAKCPFWAFAQFRLNHQYVNETSFGLNPLERGNLIHLALQKIWLELQSQSQLLNLNEKEEQDLIEKIAKQSLNEFSHYRPYTIDPLLYQLEYLQLCEMIKASLALDKSRDSFSIAGLEERIQLHIDNWDFDLRFDRLDKLENDSMMVIDYKSSLPASSPWNQDRPEHPQLLMYALAEADIAAMAYFAINPKQAEYKGISAFSSKTKGIQTLKQDWGESREIWLNHIKNLIDEITQGQIAATPENESLCERCIHRDICRKEHSG